MRIEQSLGYASILVNNAAMPALGYATRVPLETLDRALATNLRAPIPAGMWSRPASDRARSPRPDRQYLVHVRNSLQRSG